MMVLERLDRGSLHPTRNRRGVRRGVRREVSADISKAALGGRRSAAGAGAGAWGRVDAHAPGRPEERVQRAHSAKVTKATREIATSGELPPTSSLPLASCNDTDADVAVGLKAWLQTNEEREFEFTNSLTFVVASSRTLTRNISLIRFLNWYIF